MTEQEKRPRGRPTAYKPEYVEQALKLCRIGLTDVELADFFEVSVQTLHTWRSQHADFLEATKLGKDEADDRVVKSLYHRAIGYKHDAQKIFNDQGSPLVVDYVEQYPPDTAAAIFWLKNRRRDEWKDRHEVEHTGEVAIGDRLKKAREKAKSR